MKDKTTFNSALLEINSLAGGLIIKAEISSDSGYPVNKIILSDIERLATLSQAVCSHLNCDILN